MGGEAKRVPDDSQRARQGQAAEVSIVTYNGVLMRNMINACYRTFAMKYLLLDNLFYTCEMGFTDRLLFINNTYVQAQLYHASDNSEDQQNKSMSM